MSWQATGWAARQKAGSKALKMTFMALAADASARGIVFAAQEEIAELAECDARTVRRDYVKLRDRGLIRIFERERADGKHATDVIVLMMPEQWRQRTDCPVACENHFSGHLVTEKTTEAQQKVFAQEALGAGSSECPLDSAATGHSGPESDLKCPPVQNGNSSDKPLAEKAESENEGGEPPDTCVRQQGYTVNYTGRAREPGGDPDGPPGTAAPGQEAGSGGGDPPDHQTEAERTLAAEWRETILPAVEAALKRERAPAWIAEVTLRDVFVTELRAGEWTEERAGSREPLPGAAPQPAVFVSLAVPDDNGVRVLNAWRVALFRAAGYVLCPAADPRAWARREARKEREQEARRAAGATGTNRAKGKARRAG